MTDEQEKQKYAIIERPNMDFAKIPHEEGMTYEFELRTEVCPALEQVFKKQHKAESLPFDPSFVPPERGALFDFFVKSSGHVFFNLSAKKDGKVVGERQVGFSSDKFPDKKKAAELKIGVPGFVFDQGKSDPSYHFSKKFELSREQFDNVVRFVEKNVENPPTYHWPAATNCARFTKQAAMAAGIPNAKLLSIVNLPITTQAYIGISEISEKFEKIGQKIQKCFSSKEKAPEVKSASASSEIALKKALESKKKAR